MLGWSISVYRESDRKVPYPEKFELCLASWSDGTSGISWLDVLVKAGKATVDGNGYPFLYAAKAGDILPVVLAGLPAHEGPMVIGEDYVMPSGWIAEADLNRTLIAQCSADELLGIVVWDRS